MKASDDRERYSANVVVEVDDSIYVVIGGRRQSLPTFDRM